MKRISVVIVTYNSSRHIFDCLDSIFKYNDIGDDLEVIVVDNCSSEGEEMFAQISLQYGDKVKLINSSKNGGYGYGNNVGIKAASSPMIIVMNPDVRIITPIFMLIINCLKEKEVGMLGVSFIDGSSPYYFKPEYWTFKRYWLMRFYNIRHKYRNGQMYVSGSFMAFNKDCFILAGMFDENFFMYFEEPDITNRIESLGFKSVWLSNIKVLHLAHGRSFSKILNDYWYESCVYYCQKYLLDMRRLLRIRMTTFKINSYIWYLLGNKNKSRLYSDTLADMKVFWKEHLV